MTDNNFPDDVRSLWQSRPSEVPALSLEELQKASHRLNRRVFWRNVREYVAAVIVIVAFSYYFYKFQTLLLRLGSALTIAGVILVAYQLFKKGSSGTDAAESKNCLSFYRAELVKQRDLLLSVWKWYLLPLVPGLVVFFAGECQAAILQQASHVARIALGFSLGTAFAVAAGVFLLVAKVNQWAARKLQTKIEALDAATSEPRRQP